MPADRLPTRPEVPAADTWDLTRLFASDAEWEAALRDYESKVGGFARFRGRLGDGPQVLAECLRYDAEVDRLGDRVGTYSFLRTSEDVGDSTAQGMNGRFLGVATKAAEAASFVRPELFALPEAQLTGYVDAPELAEFRLTIRRLLRYRTHTLGSAEERLLAMQAETAQTARQVFEQLNNADLKFGQIEIEPGRTIELTHGSFAHCLESPNREVRKQAFHQFYAEFADHANTLAATLAGSVKQDIYHARARNYSGARAAALFPDNVPESVYDNLVAAVRAQQAPRGPQATTTCASEALKLPDVHYLRRVRAAGA